MSDREKAYAEAICNWEHSSYVYDEHHRKQGPATWHANGARAVMAVADAEQAELRAEVERLTRELTEREADLNALRGRVEAMADAVERQRSYRVRADELRALLGTQTYSGDSKVAATYHGSES